MHRSKNFDIKVWRPLEYIENDFEDRGDVVMDHATGPMWQKSGPGFLNYKKAQEYVKDLNRRKFAGYENWRLPTIPELISLLEPEKQSNDRCIHPIFDKKQLWCWSVDKRQTKGEGSSELTWNVLFNRGRVYWYDVGNSYYVRCVRPRQ